MHDMVILGCCLDYSYSYRRPKLSVYLLGLKHLGQNTLKKHWSDSTTSTALRNIADVELIVAVEVINSTLKIKSII